MVVVLDTGIVYAYYDRSDRWHSRAVGLVRENEGRLLLPAPVIPEVDHLLGRRIGAGARGVFYQGLVGAHYFVAELPRDRYVRVAALNERFAELEIGFVDAAVVAIAESLGIRRIATTDLRHFGPLAAALSLELVP